MRHSTTVTLTLLACLAAAAATAAQTAKDLVGTWKLSFTSLSFRDQYRRKILASCSGFHDSGDQGELPAAPSTAKVWYLAYFSPTLRTCTYAGSFRQA